MPSTPLSKSASRGTVISCSSPPRTDRALPSGPRVRRAELWQYIQVAQLHNAEGQEPDGGRQDQQANFITPAKNRAIALTS
jgi:hypothetical protein